MKVRRLGLRAIAGAAVCLGSTQAWAHEALPTLPSWRLPEPFEDPLATREAPRGFVSERPGQYVPGHPLPPGMRPPPEYRYTPGDMLPEGYHIEDRPRRGLLISGYLVGGIPYGFGLLIGAAKKFENQLGWLALPVAGPFLTFAFRERACNEIGETAFDSWHCVWDRTSEWFLIGDGVLQAVGGTLVIIGYGSTTPFAVRDDRDGALWVGPMLVSDGAGLGAYGSW